MRGKAPRAGVCAALAVALLTLVPLTATAAVGAPTAAAVVDAPTATIGEFDCRRLQVEITLDNTRSTRAARYDFGASFRSPLRKPYAGSDATAHADVAAGGTRVVRLPLRDDARTAVTVSIPDGSHVYAQDTCGDAPGATFGLADCDSLQLGLTLDNRTSHLPTRFRWVLADPAGLVGSETLDVDAGQVVGVVVPLVRGNWAAVEVTVDGLGSVATSERQACGPFALKPRVSFGTVDCADVSAPVVLDNSRTTTRLRFHLPGRADVILGAGETRSLRVHLPIAGRLAVTADGVLAEGFPRDLAVVSTARCADSAGSPGTAAAAGDTTPSSVPLAVPGAATTATAPVPREVAGRALEPTASSAALRPAVGLGALVLATGLGLLAARRRRGRSH